MNDGRHMRDNVSGPEVSHQPAAAGALGNPGQIMADGAAVIESVGRRAVAQPVLKIRLKMRTFQIDQATHVRRAISQRHPQGYAAAHGFIQIGAIGMGA
jgi:hypothetical protein